MDRSSILTIEDLIIKRIINTSREAILHEKQVFGKRRQKSPSITRTFNQIDRAINLMAEETLEV